MTRRQGSPDGLFAAEWQARMIQVTELLGGHFVPPPYPSDPKALRPVPFPAVRQLQALHLLLTSAAYGRDPLLPLALRQRPVNLASHERGSTGDVPTPCSSQEMWHNEFYAIAALP